MGYADTYQPWLRLISAFATRQHGQPALGAHILHAIPKSETSSEIQEKRQSMDPGKCGDDNAAVKEGTFP